MPPKTSPTEPPAQACPCDPSRAYASCCSRWHNGTPAPDAESLMRSRYAAFVLRDEPYLLATWHPDTRPPSVSFDSAQKWLGLKIIAKQTLSATRAEIEFIARYRIGGASAERLHERSRFELKDGRWLYVDGDTKLSAR